MGGFGSLSGGEILILLAIAFLVLGPGRLPEAGKAVGKGLREFKRALNQARDELQHPDAPDPPPGRGDDRDPPRRLLE
jgi:sec-independent protein translocase protein TatA